jgi:sRNA-binding regulator protein Hfq
MDILYILGTGSQWNNNELKFSLRSIEKFAKGYNRIFLTGDVKPGFINDNVIYNKIEDYSHPAINSLNKVLWTAKNTDISENFILNYDDNFLLKELDITQYPYYCKGQLKKVNDTGAIYRQSEVDTYKYLLRKGLATFNYGVHCPIIFNKKEFLEIEDIWQDCLKSQYGMLYRTIYCNYFKKQRKERPDSKVYVCNGEKDVERQISEFDCFSICNKVINKGVSEFLNHNFINKSQWEKENDN